MQSHDKIGICILLPEFSHWIMVPIKWFPLDRKKDHMEYYNHTRYIFENFIEIQDAH